MKILHTIVTMLAITLCSTVSTAQIQNEFYGCTLGNTSKEAAIQNLNKQNFSVNDQDDWLVATEVNYNGYNWGLVGFQFESGIFTRIMFMQPVRENEMDDPERAELKRKYDEIWQENSYQEISASLMKIYKTYFVQQEGKVNYSKFVDGKTKLLCSLVDGRGLVLTYTINE